MSRGRGGSAASITACHIRLQKDFEDLETLSDCCTITFPDGPDKIQHFILRIKIIEGLYRNAKFDFDFVIPDNWPIERPKVKILTRVWHPNLTEPPEGGVCLNILRKNYTPTTTLATYVTSFQYLFNEPNPRDPLNTEAAMQYNQNYNAFKLKAEEYIQNYCPKD
ncbi:NEDD8-conjugating enzyme Ubc12 [Tritrichomonas foetus]|uniref:NEDD8-conjugating enzyme Ubc12 n=1 Tax=Tritrichomonas foetus TaxID=1144522 RepID=A0A1J4K8C6_9EUKA|nr:NEDD8-conjugating enzyme Ubc12 [Tritrichomonas foetus]|eukprot:OHT07136.1 NEDD8-conjugating enzyme Ubc12 [Tritrichomonas foetus]